MAWSNGMELVNGSGNIAFAEHQNQQMMAARGNYVMSGLVVTAAVGSNLTTGADDVDISDGDCFNNATVRNLTSIASLDLSSHYSGLGSGQSRYVFIYVNTSGTVTSVAGSVATTGQQLPPDIVDKTIILAMVTLTFNDTTVDSPDIEDWQIENPTGMAMGDNDKSYWGDAGDLSISHDGSNSSIVNLTGSFSCFNTGRSIFFHANEFYLRISNRFFIADVDDSNAELLVFNTSARTLTIGASADNIASSFYGTVKNQVANAGFYTGNTDQVRLSWQSSSAEGQLITPGDNLQIVAGTATTTPRSVKIKVGASVIIQDLDDSDADLFTINASSRTLVIGDPTDNINTTMYGNLSITGTLGSISSAINSQTENPVVFASSGSPQTEYYDGSANSWGTTQNVNSFGGDVMIVPVQSALEFATLKLSTVRLTVTDPTYTNTGSTDWDVTWHYSINDGSSWTLGGAYSITSGSSGTINFDTNTVDIDGDTVTNDIKIHVKIVSSNAGIGETLDIANWISDYKINLLIS